MGSREFEEYICDLFIEIGFDAILTPQTMDGGKDLMKDDLFAVAECKRYNHTNKVGVTSIVPFHWRNMQNLFLLCLLNIINLFAFFSEKAKNPRSLNDIGKCIRIDFFDN